MATLEVRRALGAWNGCLHAGTVTSLADTYCGYGTGATALKRIWCAEHFSYWMTRLMHRLDDASPFEQQLQLAELEHVTTSRTAAKSMAENYVGSVVV